MYKFYIITDHTTLLLYYLREHSWIGNALLISFLIVLAYITDSQCLWLHVVSLVSDQCYSASNFNVNKNTYLIIHAIGKHNGLY